MDAVRYLRTLLAEGLARIDSGTADPRALASHLGGELSGAARALEAADLITSEEAAPVIRAMGDALLERGLVARWTRSMSSSIGAVAVTGIEATSAAGLAGQPPELLRVIPLNRKIQMPDGEECTVVSLELWSQHMMLSYAIVVTGPMHRPRGLDRMHEWAISDDLGNVSSGQGGGASGDGRLIAGHIVLRPAASTEARRLAIVAHDGTAEYARIEVPLE